MHKTDQIVFTYTIEVQWKWIQETTHQRNTCITKGNCVHIVIKRSLKKKLSSNKSKFAHLIIKRTLQKGIRSNNSTYAEPMPCRASRSRPGRTGSSPDGSGGRCRKGIQSLCRSGPPRPLPSGRARPTQCRSGTCSSPGGCLKKPRKNRSYNIAVSKWYQKPEARMFSNRTSNWSHRINVKRVDNK